MLPVPVFYVNLCAQMPAVKHEHPLRGITLA
jgi:hypothetical protein